MKQYRIAPVLLATSPLACNLVCYYSVVVGISGLDSGVMFGHRCHYPWDYPLFYPRRSVGNCRLRRCIGHLLHGPERNATGRQGRGTIDEVYWHYFFLTALILMVSSPTNIPLPLYGSGGLHLRTFAANRPSWCLSVQLKAIFVG